jgi:hypothetical protein
MRTFVTAIYCDIGTGYEFVVESDGDNTPGALGRVIPDKAAT